MDNIFIQMEQRLLEMPFNNNLGFIDFGKYKLATINTDQYFTKLNNKWYQEIYISSEVKRFRKEMKKRIMETTIEESDNSYEANNNQQTNKNENTNRKKTTKSYKKHNKNKNKMKLQTNNEHHQKN